MANRVKLKKSAIQNKVPLLTDLEYGELALNYTDGKLFYKDSTNTIKFFPDSTQLASYATIAGTETLLNKTLTSPTINSATANNLTLTGTLTAGGLAGTNGQVLQSTGIGVQWVTPASALTVSEIDGSNVITGSVSNVSVLRFDTDSGFDVTDLGSGAVKIGMNSTFKTWEVTGQSPLVATGLDTVRFVAGTGMTITTNPNSVPQSITFNSTGGGGNSFSTISVAGQPNVVADSSSDTLTLVAGTGITLSTNSTTDTITITSTAAGGTALSENYITVTSFVSDGTTTVYALGLVPSTDENVIVTINGVVQSIANYTVTGSNLTFVAAPNLNDKIEFRIISGVTTDASLRDFQKYLYNITTTTSTISGADANSNVLTYDTGKVDVYQNGVRLVESVDYTATNGTSITFTTALGNTDTVEILSYGAAYITQVISPSTGLISGEQSLANTTANQIVDSYSATEFRTAKYLIQAIWTNQVHCTEVLVTHNGTDAFVTEYGTMYTGASPLMTVSATLASGNINLTVSPANLSTQIDFKRISVVARTLS
jgi:hypothetical protein